MSAADPGQEHAPLKVALVIYADGRGSARATVFRALGLAQELQTAGDDVQTVFDGAGVQAPLEAYGVALLNHHNGGAGLQRFLVDGYRMVTF